MTKDIIILVVLLGLSGYFSGAETALISLSEATVRDMSQKKLKGANWVHFLKSRPHKLLITILIGNNLINILASVYATLVFQKLLGNAALGIITGALTLFILIFGEIVPKSFATSHAKTLSRLVALPLVGLFWLFSPAVWLLDLMVKLLLKASSRKKESHVTEDELKAFVTIGAEEGAIEVNEKELIENVLEFTDTRVRDIMVPRVEIQALPIDSTIHDAADFVAKHHHSRIPLYKDSLDNIVGLLTVKTLLSHMHRKEMNQPLSKLDILEPLKVPSSKKINALFNEFQKRRIHLAIVLDEHGGTAGLITLEDILEEIVGEIVDEFDEEEKSEVTLIGKTELEATGKALIEDINDELKIKIPCQDHKTISYYITEKLGRFPRRGEEIKGKGYVITVDEMQKHTIKKVTIEKKGRK
ncbi:HlyC/CorC family transporter [Candidatus Peregrinibacteria bacterium]|jgi:putative hemolysin|nr:HlyC/CorC family transporter [Candidatus Peregrinibacteria bacterium]MBT7702710.1 HlyC/CorC family transporter [Candidatus Peregrinibacteria bacterium]